MGLMAKDTGGSDFELTPSGAFPARCYAVVDLGMQKTEWNGKINVRRKVRISWELPTELMEDGRPFSVSQQYTLSLSEKARLRKDLQSWRSRSFTETELEGFDLFTVLGVPALVNVIHNKGGDGRTYANVSSISPLPRGMECPPAVNDTLRFSLDDYTPEAYEALPDWLKDKINLELVIDVPEPAYQGPPLAGPDAIPDDDLPF